MILIAKWIWEHRLASAIIAGIIMLTIFVGVMTHRARKAERVAIEERRRASQAISDAQQQTIDETKGNLTNLNANLERIQNANLKNVNNDELRNRLINAARGYPK
jgi:hypothetical protein